MIPQEVDTLRILLCQLGDLIRNTVIDNRSSQIDTLSRINSRTKADTIYEIDKITEESILEWLYENWPHEHPIQLIMEGIEDDQITCFPRGTHIDETRYQLILDPIDGTRGLMYDKRSGWALCGLASQNRQNTGIADIFVSSMTELPTSKQAITDQLSLAESGGKTHATAVSNNFVTNESHCFTPHPSKADNIAHGFVSVAKFFPAAKAAIAAFEEELLTRLLAESLVEDAIAFDDQYISTGGQLYELLSGKDRIAIDIRPIVFAKHGIDGSLCCHPYDLAAYRIAKHFGVVIESPDGSPLNAPLDTTTSVSWVGYANETLAAKARPILTELIQKHFA